MNQDVTHIADDSTTQNRVELLRKFQHEHGRARAGVSEACSPSSVPAWFEPNTFRRAQQLFHGHAIVILVSQFYGLITGLNIRDTQVPLLATGNSQSVAKLFARYISTVAHVRNWFSFCPFDQSTKSYKSLKLVRGFHRQVGEQLNRHNNNNNANHRENDNSSLWLSQWSMMDAQFGFMGYMTLFPKQLGFHCFTESDFHCMFHFWRTIFYCLGIEDQYNVCALSDQEIVECCRQIYTENYLPALKARNDQIGMGEGICIATCRFNPLNNFKVMMHYGADFMGLDKAQYPIDTLAEKIAYFFAWLSFNWLTKSSIYNWLAACSLRPLLWQAVVLGKVHQWYCNRRYGQYSYEPDGTCPLRVEINYKTVLEDRSFY